MKFDDNLSYQSDTQTLIGSRNRELVDTATGEVIQVNQITKRIYGQKNFWKVFLMDFLSALGIVDSKQLDVLIYILGNVNQSENLFIGTYRKIEKDTGVSLSTVTRIMKKLEDQKYIKKIQNGVYMVNPDIIVKGNDFKRGLLINYFNAEDTVDTMNKNFKKDAD